MKRRPEWREIYEDESNGLRERILASALDGKRGRVNGVSNDDLGDQMGVLVGSGLAEWLTPPRRYPSGRSARVEVRATHEGKIQMVALVDRYMESLTLKARAKKFLSPAKRWAYLIVVPVVVAVLAALATSFAGSCANSKAQGVDQIDDPVTNAP